MPLSISSAEDIANLLESRRGECVGKHWVRRFINHKPDLKTKMNREYGYFYLAWAGCER